MTKPRMILASSLAFVTLAACAHSPRYVTVPCISAEQYNQLKSSEPEKVAPKLIGKADEDIKLLGGSAVRLRAWGHGMLGVLEGCQS